jgi:hypothetical protein
MQPMQLQRNGKVTVFLPVPVRTGPNLLGREAKGLRGRVRELMAQAALPENDVAARTEAREDEDSGLRPPSTRSTCAYSPATR